MARPPQPPQEPSQSLTRANGPSADSVPSASPSAPSAHSRDAHAPSRAHEPDDHCGPEEHARRLRSHAVNDDHLERAAAIFRAAGDLSRLKLLYRLCDGEWCVTELA